MKLAPNLLCLAMCLPALAQIKIPDSDWPSYRAPDGPPILSVNFPGPIAGGTGITDRNPANSESIYVFARP